MKSGSAVKAIDLFCGVGGLSQGLLDAGIEVVAGIDIDPKSKYPFEKNIGGSFLEVARIGVLSRSIVWPI